MTRVIAKDLRIAWDHVNYVDESARLVSATGSMRLAPPEDSLTSGGGIVDQCSLILNNSDGRYSPLNTGGALYAYLTGGGAYQAPMYLRVSVNGGSSYDRIFTGVIKIPVESGATSKDAATVTIDCRSVDEFVMSYRDSTSLATFTANHTAGKTEAELITTWLTDAGIAAGDVVADTGMFVIPWAWLDDESPLADAWALAAACGGRLYADPDGDFRYENAAHWLKHTSSSATLTAASAGQFRPWYNDRDIYSEVVVETASRDILDADTIWTADEIVTVPSGATITYTAKMRQPAWTITGCTYTAVTSGGTDITASISITRTDYAQRSVLSIVNAHATQAAQLVVLELTGQAVSGRPGAEERATSDRTGAATFWSTRPGRTRTMSGNAYVQTQAQAAFQADFLADRYALPRLFWRVSGIPGVPARRLGDRLTLNDTSIMSAARDVFVIAITWRLGAAGFSQDYEGIDAADLFPYQNTSPGYFVIGTSTLKVSASDRLFY